MTDVPVPEANITEPVQQINDLSSEEVANAKAEIEEEFEDAVENTETGPDASGNWAVTAEELSILRAELACEYPDDFQYMR